MDAPTPKRKRGRPTKASLWLSLDEVAEILRIDAGVIERLLDKVPGALPGAIREDDGWQVPERALRGLLGSPTGSLPQMATVKEVAECVRKDVKTVYGWLKLTRPPVRPGDEPTPLLPHRQVLGTILIEVRHVLALPARMPGPRPSFFADKEAARVA